ncbi:MAG TPA: flavin reductase family protein [Intrasporangium sp.]|uniref:flavin reductase family protein n=1 Tax=Intrasporangium sp. TaxID=1925024 RepID=UPI002D795F1A|nr:flavin reductase family protein [Intrasporangium sp.]HET7397559.1 flavin reductase family protein [Intrasporangium sp.]
MTATPPPAELRRVLGHFATGVTIVTGLAPDGAPVGFACQSFASVSLDPPLVLFCASRSGRSWPLLRDTGRFCVHVLRHEQRELCDRFGSPTGRRYDGLDWELSPHGAPSLPGVLMRVHGEVAQVHEAGDHDVVIGRVLGLEDGEPGRPMLFYRGRFTVTERRTSAARGEAPDGRDDFWG